MSRDENLGWGYWLFGVIVVACAVYYWNTIHPFAVSAALANPQAAVSQPSMEATEAFVPPTASTSSPAAPQSYAPAAIVPSAQTVEAAAVIDYMNLMQNRTNWPKTIRLKVEMVIPIIQDGKSVGSVTAPAGSDVDLVRIAGEKSLVVQFANAETTVDADLTNFEELIYAKIHGTPR